MKNFLSRMAIKYLNLQPLTIDNEEIPFDDVKKVKCPNCKKSTLTISSKYLIPDYANYGYNYKYSDSYELKEQVEIVDDNFKIYGWTIEERYKGSIGDRWYGHANHKVYSTKSIALEAINQTRYITVQMRWDRYEYRVVPLYAIDQNIMREIIINKIIKEK